MRLGTIPKEINYFLKQKSIMTIILQEGSWIWARTGESIDFSSWGAGEPNNTPPYNEDCALVDGRWYVLYQDFLWNDLECSFAKWGRYQNRPICQKKIAIFDQ